MVFIIWCGIVAIHLLFTIYLSANFRRYKPEKNIHRPALSVVIAAHNELENLKKLMPALLNQDYDEFEIIVGLDRCKDDSKKYLETQGSKVKSIVIDQVPSDWNSKKFALNEAIQAANSDWIVLIDADCMPNNSHWLSSIVRNMDSETRILLGFSPYKKSASLLSQLIHFESFMTAFTFMSRALAGKPYMGVGRNMMIHKPDFLSKRGYESIKGLKGGDDDLFVQKHATSQNTQVALGLDAVVWTYPKKTWSDYFEQKTRHLSVGTEYKSHDQIFISIFHLSHVLSIIGIPFFTTQLLFWPILLFFLFIKLLSYRFAASKFEVHINYMWFPLVDMLYAVLIPIIALRSKLVKDITWKN